MSCVGGVDTMLFLKVILLWLYSGVQAYRVEVHDIFRQPDASFHHILIEANALADSLAKEGVFHSSVSFDV